MAETNVELDAINHLLDIEKQASELITEAQIEADKRMAEARAKYNAEYKSKYDSIAAELEQNFQNDFAAITKKYADEVDAYKKSLEENNKNKEQFSKLLDKLLFA